VSLNDDSDDPNDPDFIPDDDAHGPSPLQRNRYRKVDVMAEAMDDLNAVLMAIQGITPQEAAKRREKRMEAEELKAQEASRSKVMEWKKTMDADGS
jgi:hypothetical protein